jgi:hypothetical protein
MSRPDRTEAAPPYFTYIDLISSDDIVGVLESQLEEVPAFLYGIPEEKSLYRYAPEKWSMRQALSHINDTERAFVFRALWFAREFTDALPSFDQNISVAAARADEYPWKNHVAEFRDIRRSTVALFGNMPLEAWKRGGVASGKFVTVNALAYILAGHVAHHVAILRERYL